MHLSDGMVVGLCCGFSQVVGQLTVVVSAKDAAGYLRPVRPVLLKVVGWSTFYAVLFSVAISALDGAGEHPGHGLNVSFLGLFAIAWIFMGLSVFASASAKRIKQATGADILGRAIGRAALIGGALGMILSGLYIFGGHLLRG